MKDLQRKFIYFITICVSCKRDLHTKIYITKKLWTRETSSSEDIASYTALIVCQSHVAKKDQEERQEGEKTRKLHAHQENQDDVPVIILLLVKHIGSKISRSENRTWGPVSRSCNSSPLTSAPGPRMRSRTPVRNDPSVYDVALIYIG